MAGIVLAGGRSSRMGTDKALLPWAGATIIESVIRRVAAVDEDVIVVAETACRYNLPEGVRLIGDLYPGAGPLGGIVTGLTSAGDGCHLVVACDMPGVEPALLRALLGAARGFDAAVPEIQGRLEPLCAAYAAACLEPLRSALLSGNRAVHRAIGNLRLNRILEPALRAADPTLASFANINTQDEYRDLSAKPRRACEADRRPS